MNHFNNYTTYDEAAILKDLELAETQFESMARRVTVTAAERTEFQNSINGARNVIRNRVKERMNQGVNL